MAMVANSAMSGLANGVTNAASNGVMGSLANSAMSGIANGTIHGLANGTTNGLAPTSHYSRFSDIPSAIDIPVSGHEGGELVEISLEELSEDPTELCTLLDDENASKHLWMTVSLAYAKQHMIDHAIEILNRGLQTLSRGPQKEKVGPLSLQCWLYLGKSRHAPRVMQQGELVGEAKTKDFYLQAATAALNEALRLHPAHPPLYLARGVLVLLRSSLMAPNRTLASGAADSSERTESLRQALKSFEDAGRVSDGRNMLALVGKARTLFALHRFADALQCFQEVLAKMPDLHDPEPRIGIGCCLWRLNHIEEAREAFERALEVNPHSKAANDLLALYHLQQSFGLRPRDPAFAKAYKLALATYACGSMREDPHDVLSHTILGEYFLSRQEWDTVERLAREAIQMTDVNASASDGWFLLARKEHYQTSPDYNKVIDLYTRADNARGGGERGYLPARFGIVQAMVLKGDATAAKFRLEKLVQQTQALEVKILLGVLYAQEVFESQAANSKEDKSVEQKKAIALLDAARAAWGDGKKKLQPDVDVLLILSRLHEALHPDKSLQCLLQAQELALRDLAEVYRYAEIEDEITRREKQRQHLPPQLLSNIGCLQYQAEHYEEATEAFQLALSACMNSQDGSGADESDQLVTTISYNLARSYEAAGLLDEACKVYEGLLTRHPGYTDARLRLAYIELRRNPNAEGPKAMAALYEAEPQNLEVRALYGWYLSKAKRRTLNIAEDQEQRLYKHTLQHYDKHDLYALTGMGNIHLACAREMRPTNDQDRDKRRRMYEKSVEFYHKALQLDECNAYAAQGIAIAFAEDRRDFSGALHIFNKVKDSLKDASVLVNMGHVYAELKQYHRAIDSYEAAVAKDPHHGPQLLACLGRVWLHRARQESSVEGFKAAIRYSLQALTMAPDQIHYQFNLAFTQMAMASSITRLPESRRTLADLEEISQGLEEAIETLFTISKNKAPPYPRHEIEGRANMGRNTLRKQLDRALEAQRAHEAANATKMAEAQAQRAAELEAKEQARLAAEAEEAERRRKLHEERERLLERAREMAEQRADEERRREEAEMTEDSQGERVRRKRRPRATGGKRKKKHGQDADEDNEDDGLSEGDDSNLDDGDRDRARPSRRARRTAADDGDEGTDSAPAPRKKRRLARKSESKATSSKYKSAEMVVDSDDDDDDGDGNGNGNGDGAFGGDGTGESRGDLDSDHEGARARASARTRAGNRAGGSVSEEDTDTDMRDAGDAVDANVGARDGSAVIFDDDEEDEEKEEEEEDAVVVKPSVSRPARPRKTARMIADVEGDEDE